MKKILVLVDATATAEKAVDQAIALAKRTQADISLCYVSKHDSDDEIEALKLELGRHAQRVQEHGLKAEVVVKIGDLEDEVKILVGRSRPDLVVIGTHGKQGVRQNLFGTAIHKLVKEIQAPSLVVNDFMDGARQGFASIMLPVAPHEDYLNKVKHSCLVLSDQGRIVIFAILKPGIGLDTKIQKNIQEAKEFLDKEGVKWDYLEVDADRYSVGFARQTIDEAKNRGMDLLSIMANVSNENQHFGKIDKENVLLNDAGIAVLCSN
jgi:nucleotide-binding universal stress UspA family protein